MQVVDLIWISVRRLRRRIGTCLILGMIVWLLALAVVLSWTASDALQAERSRLMRQSQKVEIIPTARSGPITAQTMAQFSAYEPVAAVAPRFHRTLYVQSPSGRFVPVQSTNFVPDDWGLRSVRVLEGQLPQRLDTPGLILAPNLCQELGLPTRGVVGQRLTLGVYWVQGGERKWTTFHLPVQAIVGQLGLEGMRIDLATMRRIVSLPYERLAQTPPTAPASVYSLLEPLPEIHTLELYPKEPIEENLPRIHQLVEHLGFRVTSLYYQQASSLELIEAGLQLSLWFAALVGGLAAAAFPVLLGQAVHQEQPLVCLWRSAGLRRWEVFFYYWLQTGLLCAAGSLLGILTAIGLLQGQIGTRLAELLHLPLADFALQAACKSGAVFLLGSMLTGSLPALWAVRKDIDDLLRKAACVG